MKENVRETVEIGQSLPEQDLRVPLKHALVDLRTDLKQECEDRKLSYNSASKAMSGHHAVTGEAVRNLFQELLHRWRPGAFQPATGQDDLVVGTADRLDDISEVIDEAEKVEGSTEQTE